MTGEKAVRLLERERFELSKKSGGGILQYEAWGYQEKEEETMGGCWVTTMRTDIIIGTGWGPLSLLISNLMRL